MKQKSEKIKDSILKAAETEFLKVGFRGASMRKIAMSVNGTTGIVYTYFKNKDEIFETLIQPATMLLEARLSENVLPLQDAKNTKEVNPEFWFTQNLNFLISIIEKYPNEMTLLLIKSDGSSFQNYKDMLIEKGTERSIKAFRQLERSKAFEGQLLSEFFIRNLVMYIINIVVELLRQNKHHKDIVRYKREITAFLFSGWKALVKT